MTLVSAIVSDAFRESNILSLSKSPTAAQAAEALNLLDQIFAGIYGSDAGENLVDWPLGNFGIPDDMDPLPYTVQQFAHPQINSRMVALNEAAMTVELPIQPQDGCRYGIVDPLGRLSSFPVTVSASGRTIEGAPTVLVNTNGSMIEWIYSAGTANWARITGITAAGQMPFPHRWDRMFTILLAIRLNPRYGRSLDPQSATVLKRDERDFVNRYLQSKPQDRNGDISWPFMSRQSFGSGRSFSSTSAFNTGNILGGS